MTNRENQQFQKITEKIAEMKERQKTLVARDNARQRKERTRRLIKIGTLTEKYLKFENMDMGEFEKLLKDITIIHTSQKK